MVGNGASDDTVTCWTVIQRAAAGNARDRSEFSHRYLPVVRNCLLARWQHSRLRENVDDAVQEVFLECFREHGVLDRLGETQPRMFKSFLLGVAGHVAQRAERRWAQRRARMSPTECDPDELPADDDSLSKHFDRAWARSLLQQAADMQQRRARSGDAAAQRRVELLRLRFEDGLTIQEIAVRWGEEPQNVHGIYRRARQEYRDCLRSVVAFHNPGPREAFEHEYQRLLALID